MRFVLHPEQNKNTRGLWFIVNRTNTRGSGFIVNKTNTRGSWFMVNGTKKRCSWFIVNKKNTWFFVPGEQHEQVKLIAWRVFFVASLKRSVHATKAPLMQCKADVHDILSFYYIFVAYLCFLTQRPCSCPWKLFTQ